MHVHTHTHMQQKSYSCHRQAILTAERQPSPMCSFYYSLAYELHRTLHSLTVCMCVSGCVYSRCCCLFVAHTSFIFQYHHEGEMEDGEEKRATLPQSITPRHTQIFTLTSKPHKVTFIKKYKILHFIFTKLSLCRYNII